MSDSGSELSPTIPSNKELEAALKLTISRLRVKDADAELTVNHVRRVTEQELQLDEGFFKGGSWKIKSKDIIIDYFNQDVDDRKEIAKAEKAQVKAPPKKPAKAEKKEQAQLVGKKRKVEATGRPKEPAKRKKRRTSDDSESEAESSADFSDEGSSDGEHKDQRTSNVSDSELSDDESETSQPKKNRKAAVSDDDGSSSLTDADSEPASKPKPKAKPKQAENASDSEMSVLIDDSPARKPKKKSASKSKPSPSSTSKADKPKPRPKPKPSSSSTAATAATATADPEQEEIKKLQGQLGQCGIRKVWGKYLKPYETAAAKIKHLREMLVDAGMTGRFSQDKAKQIRTQRELAEDLEAVTEGEKAWGRGRRGAKQEEEAEEDLGTRPRRTLAKGLAELDEFSDESD